MKKAIFILCLVSLLTACTNSKNESSIISDATTIASTNSVITTNKLVNPDASNYNSFPFNDDSGTNDNSLKPSKAFSKLTVEEISKLNTKKIGFGQGLRLDAQNRPYCSLDFNAQFGKYDSYAIKDEKNIVYLTFDQGYENGYTAKILDVLKEKKVKATFFILQDYVNRNEALVQRMIDEGHTLGNHSVHHYSMPTLDINTAKNEILGIDEYMLQKFNYEMTLFRPPMGEYSEQSLAVTQLCGYKTVLWSYAYADWDPAKQMEPSVALEKVTNAAHPGCIYLLHSVSKTNTEILSQLIDNLKSKGYSFGIPQ